MIPTEIERKFMVKHMPTLTQGARIVQGYLTEKETTVRVRITDGQPMLTIKGKDKEKTLVKPEFEYAIPIEHAKYMLTNMCGTRIVKKTRYLVRSLGDLLVPGSGQVYELDIFEGNLMGMVIAEIEFKTLAEADAFVKPLWLGKEVTDDKRYKNKKLAVSQQIPDNYKGPK